MSTKEAYITGITQAFAETPYARWLGDEGVAIHEGFSVADVRELDLSPWPRIGGNAVFITLYAQMEANIGLYLVEIPPERSLEPERWCCQKIVLIEEGIGSTEVWQEGETRKQVFEWGKGSVFAIPINACHRMHNLGHEPAKFVVMNSAPLMMKGFGSAQFVFDCPLTFREFYSGNDNQYFVESNNKYRYGREGAHSNWWETNYIRDAWTAPLQASNKAYGNLSHSFRMVNRTYGGTIHEWPAGRYHQAHFHGPGALLHTLRSEGFVMLWPYALGMRPFEAGHADEVVIQPFGEGGFYSPPSNWFHAHFNTGPGPMRQIAFYGHTAFSDLEPRRVGRGGEEFNATHESVSEGGRLIRYWQEDPEVRRRFKAILDAKGIPFDMPDSLFTQPEAERR
jgi:oxalate decarboxylase/phosphoglucose isomerase-like protein (cupin superfamily)